MLNEIEESCRCLLGIRNSENEAERMSTAEQLLKQWSTRFETVQVCGCIVDVSPHPHPDNISQRSLFYLSNLYYQ